MKRTSQTDKTALFETMPVPKAVLTLAVPTVASILVTLLYSLADTWFVGLLNDPIQNAAVTLIAPVLLAFNAVNNLFGTGCSSMMSRALGRKDTETAQRCSSFGFWCSLLCGILFSVLHGVPASAALGSRRVRRKPRRRGRLSALDGQPRGRARDLKRRAGLFRPRRGQQRPCQRRHDVRLRSQHSD